MEELKKAAATLSEGLLRLSERLREAEDRSARWTSEMEAVVELLARGEQGAALEAARRALRSVPGAPVPEHFLSGRIVHIPECAAERLRGARSGDCLSVVVYLPDDRPGCVELLEIDTVLARAKNPARGFPTR